MSAGACSMSFLMGFWSPARSCMKTPSTMCSWGLLWHVDMVSACQQDMYNSLILALISTFPLVNQYQLSLPFTYITKFIIYFNIYCCNIYLEQWCDMLPLEFNMYYCNISLNLISTIISTWSDMISLNLYIALSVESSSSHLLFKMCSYLFSLPEQWCHMLPLEF